jgi:hypothetical protein
MEQNLDENKLFRYKIYDWLVDWLIAWLVFNMMNKILELVVFSQDLLKLNMKSHNKSLLFKKKFN